MAALLYLESSSSHAKKPVPEGGWLIGGEEIDYILYVGANNA